MPAENYPQFKPRHLIRQSTLLELLGGISKSLLHSWIRDGKWPRPTHFNGSKLSFWPADQVDLLIKEKTVASNRASNPNLKKRAARRYMKSSSK